MQNKKYRWNSPHSVQGQNDECYSKNDLILYSQTDAPEGHPHGWPFQKTTDQLHAVLQKLNEGNKNE
jgi:hypothetical protein